MGILGDIFGPVTGPVAVAAHVDAGLLPVPVSALKLVAFSV